MRSVILIVQLTGTPMKKFVLIVLLFLPLWLNAKVYDCFPFFNEFELLKIRFDELNDVVDYFVLVESVETQRGNPKPLHFQEKKGDVFRISS